MYELGKKVGHLADCGKICNDCLFFYLKKLRIIKECKNDKRWRKYRKDFSMKCEMGQKIYLIISEVDYEERPHCGETISYTICDWKIWKTARIDGITVTEHGTFYSLDDGGQISESMIDDKIYFTTRQAAQNECDRRNRERNL